MVVHPGGSSEEVTRVGVLGRFQPFHWGHLDYLWEASRGAQEMVIGITAPNADSTYHSESATHRSQPSSNPFTFLERKRMIADVCHELGTLNNWVIRSCSFDSVETLSATFFDCDYVATTVYDLWGEERERLLVEAGLKVFRLWRRDSALTSGSEVRQAISRGESWEHLVPPPVSRYIREILRTDGTRFEPFAPNGG